MRRSQMLLFACASGLSVANVYYAQPLLDALARDFAIPAYAIGGVVTATQVGCALALVLLVPLGDIFARRHLMLAQALVLVLALTAVGMSSSTYGLLGAMCLTGMLGTAMTQGLIAYAAAAAPAHERGRVVGAAQSGVFLGLLLARVVAGVVSDLAGWRAVYFGSASAMLLLAVGLWARLPSLPAAAQRIGYPALLVSMFGLLRHNRVLQVRGMLALLMFAAFNIFWSALVLPLSAPPYAFSHTVIGAFGLVGAVGALAGAGAGRQVDRGFGERTTLWALLCLIAAWLPLAGMTHWLWALVPGILLLDLAGQALHVTNQSLILNTQPDAQGRLVGVYMLFYAVGSALGAFGTTVAYAVAGWGGVCTLGALVSLAALVFWACARPRRCPADGRQHRRGGLSQNL